MPPAANKVKHPAGQADQAHRRRGDQRPVIDAKPLPKNASAISAMIQMGSLV